MFVNILSLTLQIGMDLVYAENKIKNTALRVLISSAIGLVLAIIVAPKYGAVGCAAATGAALVLTQILYVDFYQRNMELDMWAFFKKCHLRIVPLITIYAGIGFVVSRFLQIHDWSTLVLSIALYTIGFCLIFWYFLANDYEKHLVSGFFDKF